MPDILDLVQNRHSTRAVFDCDRPLAGQDLQRILEAGRWAPTAHNMQNFEVLVVDDPELLDSLASLRRPISETFLRENLTNLSYSEEELSRKKVGLLSNQFPPAWLNPDTLAQAVAESGHAPRSFPPCPVMLFILYDPSRRAPDSEGDFLGIISLGCMTENMWLEAESLGIAMQIVSAFGAGPLQEDARQILGIPAHLRIAFTIRLGYSAGAPGKGLRVRREVADFTHHNRFGEKGLK